MNSEDLNTLKIAISGLYSSVQSCGALNLATMKLLAQRLSILEIAFAASLGESGEALAEGQEEVAQLFTDRIARIETHQEQVEAYFTTLKGFLNVTE